MNISGTTGASGGGEPSPVEKKSSTKGWFKKSVSKITGKKSETIEKTIALSRKPSEVPPPLPVAKAATTISNRSLEKLKALKEANVLQTTDPVSFTLWINDALKAKNYPEFNSLRGMIRQLLNMRMEEHPEAKAELSALRDSLIDEIEKGFFKPS